MKQMVLDLFLHLPFNNDWILEHMKYNIQCCPSCYQEYLVDKEEALKRMYNDIWKKKLSKRIDLWYCKSCKEYFRLVNKATR